MKAKKSEKKRYSLYLLLEHAEEVERLADAYGMPVNSALCFLIKRGLDLENSMKNLNKIMDETSDVLAQLKLNSDYQNTDTI